jgi:hypothetical protein
MGMNRDSRGRDGGRDAGRWGVEIQVEMGDGERAIPKLHNSIANTSLNTSNSRANCTIRS